MTLGERMIKDLQGFVLGFVNFKWFTFEIWLKHQSQAIQRTVPSVDQLIPCVTGLWRLWVWWQLS